MNIGITSRLRGRTLLVTIFLFLLMLQSTSCDRLATTEPEVNLPATIAAMQATMAGKPTEYPTEAPPSADLVATSVAATIAALQPTQTLPTPEAQPTETEAPPEPETSETDFEEWMQTAKIVVYEDMSGVKYTRQYVQESLEAMGVPFKDDGSAKGWLKDDLLYGPEGGGAWDLVILATERRAGLSGEFFTYLEKNLEQGSSVIIEA